MIVHRGGETVVEGRGEAPCTELCHFESVERPYGVRLVGEIDASNVGRLDEVLAGLLPAGDVHVDMTRLEFIDLRGLRDAGSRRRAGGSRRPAWCWSSRSRSCFTCSRCVSGPTRRVSP